jgi:hypothetical protein
LPDWDKWRLATSDSGLVLNREVWREQMERVKQGQDPIGIVRGLDEEQFERPPVNPFAHERGVEFSRGRFVVMMPQLLAQGPRPGEMNPAAAARPEEEFEPTFEENEVPLRSRIGFGKNFRVKAGNGTLGALQRDLNRDRPLARSRPERATGQHGRAKCRIEDRFNSGTEQRQPRVCIDLIHAEMVARL